MTLKDIFPRLTLRGAHRPSILMRCFHARQRAFRLDAIRRPRDKVDLRDFQSDERRRFH